MAFYWGSDAHLEMQALFDLTTKLRKHSTYRSQRGTPCADIIGGEAIFQNPKYGPNLQPVSARIVVFCLFSVNQLTHCA